MKMLQHQRLRCPTSCKSVQKCHSTSGTHSRLWGLVAVIKSRMEAFKLLLSYSLFILKQVVVFLSPTCRQMEQRLYSHRSASLSSHQGCMWKSRFLFDPTASLNKSPWFVWFFFFFITLQACYPHHVQARWNLPICWVRLGNRSTMGGFNF